MINFRLFLGKFPLVSRLCCYLYLEKTWKTSAVSFWEWAKETFIDLRSSLPFHLGKLIFRDRKIFFFFFAGFYHLLAIFSGLGCRYLLMKSLWVGWLFDKLNCSFSGLHFSSKINDLEEMRNGTGQEKI